MAGTTALGHLRPSTEGGSTRRQAGRYVLGDLLGRGGMAEVFAGHAMGDHGFQKPVAIKRLLPELANDTVFVERLIGEAKLLVGMTHGNIVSVLDLARDGDDVFLVMEFVDGPSLRQLIKARGSRGLSFGVTSYIIQSAAAGLESAHARPGGAIIHADISPSNLLLTTSGEVRVADFGIARREGGGTGVVEGKWAYMAPEQARGEALTPRSDVFALGVVLYELLTGQHPFGQKVTANEREHEQMRVIPPRVINPKIPPGLDAICMRALAHDPRERYARMSQLIDAIVEERFANQWREGASDLAAAIREVSPGAVAAAAVHQPRTVVTDRPVTIVTRSLIRELTPVRRSAPRLPAHTPEPTSELTPPTLPPFAAPAPTATATAATPTAVIARGSAPALPAAMFEIPPALRADAAPMPAFRMSHATMPSHDLASVHGGTAASPAVDLTAAGDAPRTGRWAFGILGLAAIVGVIAAMLISLDADELPQASAAPAARVEPQVAAISAPPAPAPAPTITAPAPTITAPAPNPQPAPTPTTATAPVAAEPAVTDAAPVTRQVPAPRPARSKPAAAAKKKDPGVLRVNAMPWGYVSIDGGARKEAPASYSLAPGRHTVKIFNDDGAVKVRSITLESGQAKKIIANLDDGSVQELP